MREELRSFFSKLFSNEQNPKTTTPEPTSLEKEAAIASRRNFLKGAGAIAALAMAEKIIPTAEASELKNRRTPEVKKSNSKEKSPAESAFEQARTELKRFSVEHKLAKSDIYHRTTAELDALHQAFNERFSDSIVETLTLAKQLNKEKEITAIYTILKECNALGYFYKFTTEFSADEHEKINLDLEWNLDRFQSQAADFLPSGAQVQDAEIDPRLLQITTKYTDGELLFPEEPRVSVEKTIQKAPGWTDPTLTAAFRATLDDPEVRHLFSASDCSLAEVYSIIKAAIKTDQLTDQGTAPAQTIQELLVEREQFKTKEILGPNTDNFIHFTLNDPTIDPEIAQQLGALATIWNKGEKPMVHKIKNDSERGKQKNTETDPDPIVTDLNKTIENCRGNILIYLSTHGSNEAIGLHHGDTNRVLSTKDLAASLLGLVYATQNPKALATVTLLDSICHNYDFTQQLARDLQSTYTGNAQELALPTVITSAQTGSMAYTNGFAGETLKNFLPAISKERALTGEFLMRRIQPQAYLFGDASFFTGKQTGAWQEIGAATPSTKQPTV